MAVITNAVNECDDDSEDPKLDERALTECMPVLADGDGRARASGSVSRHVARSSARRFAMGISSNHTSRRFMTEADDR